MSVAAGGDVSGSMADGGCQWQPTAMTRQLRRILCSCVTKHELDVLVTVPKCVSIDHRNICQLPSSNPEIREHDLKLEPDAIEFSRAAHFAPHRSVVQTFKNRSEKLVEVSKLQTEYER